MSAYISIWIKANSGGPYICLNSWSRSTVMYQLFNHQVDYGTFKELAEDMLREAIDLATADVKTSRDMINHNNETLAFLRGCPQLSVEELLDNYNEYQDSNDQYQESIDETEFAIAQVRTFWQILDEQQYGDNTGTLYIAHECDPNYKKSEDEKI